jgi:sugar O-acyltransferase (sialic acid O-acetyltransferase NeuD family)
VTQLIGVYGAGGCGRGILPIVRAAQHGADLVFVDDEQAGKIVNGHPVLTWEQFQVSPALVRTICIAVSMPAVRDTLARRCDAAKIPLYSARAASVVEMDDVSIGEGACLSPFVTLTSNIRIGRCFHANLYSYVEHDCVVGDFVTLAPGAKVNGNVTLHDHVYVGSGAVIKQGLSVGRGAVIGMGAIVTHDVPPGKVVVGNPARALGVN